MNVTATTTAMAAITVFATAAGADAITATAVIVQVFVGFLPLQLLYILLLYLLLMHCRPVAVLKSLLILLFLLLRSLLHTVATSTAYAIATSRPCHLLKLMTPGQIITPLLVTRLGVRAQVGFNSQNFSSRNWHG